ncbi:19956_t:CDS:10 [Funneliformis geosporum]|uniref:19956_t:CDS:1 n=1 Tax=Funneliformis geosporum TaxID=1117311 RepID=A0A9W4SQS1_9GLOM|nr:19956_t:CDS:10 [Funneliformis geosporum]
MPPRNHPIPSQAQPTVNNHHHNNNTLISSGQNNIKPVEQTVHDEVSSEHMHDRLMFLLVNFIGMNVLVTVKNGAKYQGLLKTASTNGELGVVLKMARKVLTKVEEKTVQNRVIPTYIIMAKDLMEIHACEVDFSACDKMLSEREGSGAGFRIDTDISGRAELREQSSNVSWDQFAANEQLFGIKTDFNEEIYTTKLDRSRADFKERERQAIAIANEITRSSTTNVHMLEERGFIVEETQMDEEERYGAVVRSRDPSKYMPPQLRKLQEQHLQQTGSSPAAKKSEPSKEPAKEVIINPEIETKPFRIPEPVAALLNSHTPKKIGIDAEAQIVTTFRQFATNEKERLQQRKQAIARKEMDGKMAELLKWGQTFKLNSPLPQDLIPILTKDESKRQQLAAKSVAALNEKGKEKDSEKQRDKEKEKEKPQDKEKAKEKQLEKEKEKEKDKLKEKDNKPKEKVTLAQNLEPKSESRKPEIKIEEDKSHKTNGDSTESKSTNDKSSDKSISAADKAPLQFPPGRTTAITPTNSQFKLNAKASEWKPNPNAASFTPITPNTQDKRSPGSSPFFGNRQLKKNIATLRDGFTPFQKSKSVANPSSIPPTWPFGQRPFRHHFSVTNNYDEDMYSQATVTQGFGFAAYPVTGPYRYPPNTQFVGVPPIPIQQGAPIPPYMQPGFVPGMPFTTAPMPPTGAPPMYSAQLPSVMPQHFGSQGFPSPGRTPMVPATIHPQMYQPYQNPHAMPPMIRYPHDMVQHVSPNGVMISQRPMMMEPHYLQPEAAPMEGMPVTESTTINQ